MTSFFTKRKQKSRISWAVVGSLDGKKNKKNQEKIKQKTAMLQHPPPQPCPPPSGSGAMVQWNLSFSLKKKYLKCSSNSNIAHKKIKMHRTYIFSILIENQFFLFILHTMHVVVDNCTKKTMNPFIRKWAPFPLYLKPFVRQTTFFFSRICKFM